MPKNSQVDFDVVQYWLALNVVQRRVSDIAEDRLRGAGLPGLKAFDVLFALARESRPMTAQDIQGFLAFEQSNLSRLLKTLVDQRLIKETPNPKDGRSKLLTLTKEGNVCSREIWSVYWPVLESELAESLAGERGAIARGVMLSLPGAKDVDRFFWEMD